MCCQELKEGLYNNLEGWGGAGDGREVHEGEHVCIRTADSRWYLAENKKIL